jgi:hypothetical protein
MTAKIPQSSPRSIRGKSYLTLNGLTTENACDTRFGALQPWNGHRCIQEVTSLSFADHKKWLSVYNVRESSTTLQTGDAQWDAYSAFFHAFMI